MQMKKRRGIRKGSRLFHPIYERIYEVVEVIDFGNKSQRDRIVVMVHEESGSEFRLNEVNARILMTRV
jgi:hypothetical protein